MKQKIKKLFKIIYGNDSNIYFKLTVTFFIACIVFLLFMITAPQNSNEWLFFVTAFDMSFAIWLIMAKGANSATKFAYELLRLIIFIGTFIYSFYTLYFFDFYNNLRIAISCIGLIASLYYFVVIFTTLFDFIKKLFNTIKSKLFNSVQSTESKIQKLIETITTFLVSIASLGVAIKTIIEPLVNIFNQLAQ